VSGTKVVIDTDILSMFAKVGAVHILGTFFGQGRIVMMPAIHERRSQQRRSTSVTGAQAADALEVPSEVEMEIFGGSGTGERDSHH
jgi:hypothetical protein